MNQNTINIYVVDLDNTICNSISMWEQTKGNPTKEEILNCKTMNASLLETLKDKDFYVLTARTNNYYYETLEWLEKNNIRPKKLYMKSNHKQSDIDFKREKIKAIRHLEEHEVNILNKIEIVVYDDNKENIEIFKEEGCSTNLV